MVQAIGCQLDRLLKSLGDSVGVFALPNPQNTEANAFKNELNCVFQSSQVQCLALCSNNPV